MREMKDSQTEWLGKIPNNWKLIPGKYLFEQRNTRGNSLNLELLSPTQQFGVISQSEYEKLTGMKAVKLKEKTDLSQLKTIHSGDYCISLRSFQGGFEYSRNEGVVSPAYQVFFAKVPTYKNYYKYLFKDDAFISKMNSYTMSLRDGKNIAFSDFGKTLIPYPSLNEQQAIADFLDSKCADINSLAQDIQKQIETLKEYKKSVITQAVTKGLDPNVEMKDSGIEWIGEIPKDWKLCRLKNLLANVERPIVDGPFGSDLKNEEYVDYGVPLIQLGNIGFAYHKLTPLKFITPAKAKQLSGHIAKSGDIVIAKMMPAGKATIVSTKYPEFVISADCIRVIFNQSKVYYPYIVLAINTLCQKEAEINAKGATRARINLSKVKNLYIVLPTWKEQKSIADFLDTKCADIDAAIDGKQKQLDVLKEYKKSLIYEYVTGKKEVPCRE